MDRTWTVGKAVRGGASLELAARKRDQACQSDPLCPQLPNNRKSQDVGVLPDHFAFNDASCGRSRGRRRRFCDFTFD
jgi:hypothetical protein